MRKFFLTAVIVLSIIAAVFAALLGLVSAASQDFTPQAGSFSIKAGTKVNDGFNAGEVAGQDCAAGTCSSTNSWNLGINSDVPTDVNTQVLLSYDLSTLGITGSQITGLTFNLGGCWHQGTARSCNDSSNPGFDSAGGKALIYVLHGTTWEQIGAKIGLGNSTSSTADNYQTYLRSKSGGFADDYLNSGILKIKVRTVGKTTGSLDVLEVIDFATVNIAYNAPTPTPIVTPSPSPTPSPGLTPNIIVIETDDQRWDFLNYMPTVRNRIVNQGMNFTNSFVTSPVCCPSRASFLTGLYQHNHNTTETTIAAFRDSQTLAVWLHNLGYRTSFVGKYLNGYENLSPYIPPGWDDWHAFVFPGYYNYDLNDNGVINHYGSLPQDYSTDVLRDKALDFINSPGNRPFFMWLTPRAPHGNIEVAPRHVGTCDSLVFDRPPSFNEADVSDKPAWVQALSLANESSVTDVQKRTVCSLKAVDEAVGAILDALGPEVDNTVVIFTSDNGLSFGEHRWRGKQCEFDECSRVPLVIRYPVLISAGSTSSKFALNIDLAPTIADIVGAAIPVSVNGRSLVPLFADPNAGWRDDFLVESKRNDMSLMRNGQYKYVELGTGEKEFYNLVFDPYELENQINNPAYTTVISQLAVRLAQLKQE